MRWVVVLAAALAAPAAARAFDWNGRLGVLYGRGDRWAVDGVRSTEPRLDLDLALDLNGSIAGQGVLDYVGGVQYRRIASTIAQREDVTNQLSYHLRALAFGNPRSPLRLDVAARRADDDIASAGSSLGTSTTTSYSGRVTVAVPERPSLQVGYTYDRNERDLALVGASNRSLQTLDALARQGANGYSYSLRYRGQASEGTYASDRFDEHQAELDASTALTRTLDAQLTQRYMLRLPNGDSIFNPRQESSALSGVLRRESAESNSTQRIAYQYVHGVQTATGLEDVERTSHAVDLSYQRRFSPAWRLRGTANASFADDRLGATERQTAGQTLGALAYWRRPRGEDFVELRGGPSVGILEPADGDASFGWGGTAGGTATWSRDLLRVNVTYDVWYDKDLFASEGWSLRQQGSAGADRPLGTGFLHAQLLLGSERHTSSLFGPGASRNVNGRLDYRFGPHLLGVEASLAEGIAGRTTGLSGDGLFLPAPYDTHVRSTAINASTVVMRRLLCTGRLAYSSTDLPDRPSLDEGTAIGSIDWMYGALRIGVEDRYAFVETTTGTARTNQVLLRAYRSFGSRY